jgi:hypothetical protein
MTIHDWLRTAVEDAHRRGLPALEPLLEGLSQSTIALREAERTMDCEEADAGASAPAEPGAATRE